MKDRDPEYLQNIIDYCLKIDNILNHVNYDTFVTEEIYQLSCSMCVIDYCFNVLYCFNQ